MLLGAEVNFVKNWFESVQCKHGAFEVCQNLQGEMSDRQQWI